MKDKTPAISTILSAPFLALIVDKNAVCSVGVSASGLLKESAAALFT